MPRSGFTAKELTDLRASLEQERADLEGQLRELEESSFSSGQSELTGETSFDDEFADAGTATFERERLRVEQWYGIRVATDDVAVDTPAPPPDELARILEVETRLGRTDPYRRLGTLVHVVAHAPEWDQGC